MTTWQPRLFLSLLILRNQAFTKGLSENNDDDTESDHCI